MKFVLISFPDEKIRDKFLEIMKSAEGFMAKDPNLKDEHKIVTEALSTIKFDPPLKTEGERSAALYVSGVKMCEGPLPDMKRRCTQEINTHKGSVELKEFRNGEWVTIQSRRPQR